MNTMDKNREIYAQIFQQNNPNRINQQYVDPLTGQLNPNFWQGYGPLQQDVIVNSFLTTYRGEQASGGERNLSPFSRLPLPNWNIQYNGLTQIPVFKKSLNPLLSSMDITLELPSLIIIQILDMKVVEPSIILSN